MLKFILMLVRLGKAGLPVLHAAEAVAVAVDPELAPAVAVLSDPKNEAAVEAIVSRIEADVAAANPPKTPG